MDEELLSRAANVLLDASEHCPKDCCYDEVMLTWSALKAAIDVPDKGEKHIQRLARELLVVADGYGLVVTIERQALVPLAMGNAEYVVDVRPKRGGSMSTTPWYTDQEIDDLCAGLANNSAKVRHLRAQGLTVTQKPNGRPLVMRAHAEAVLAGLKQVQADAAAQVERPRTDRAALLLAFGPKRLAV